MDNSKKYKYIKREFESGEYRFLAMFLLNEINDLQTDHHKSVFSYLQENDQNLYNEIFSILFSRDRFAFENCTKIIPYLDLKCIISHMEEKILKMSGDERVQLVSLHDFYSQVLYGIILLRKFAPHEIFALDPVLYMAKILPHKDKINIIHMLVRNNMCNNDIDKKYVLKSMIFSKDNAAGYTEIPEYLLSDDIPSDFFEVFDKTHEMIISTLKSDNNKEIILKSLLPLIFVYDDSGQYDKGSKIVDIIYPAYHDISSFSKIFLRMKFLNREFDSVINFISGKYTEEEILNNHGLSDYYGTSLVMIGKISEGNRYLNQAYVTSGYNQNTLISLICGQIYIDSQNVVDILNNHIENDYLHLSPTQILLLLQDFVEKYPPIAKVLIRYFEQLYMVDRIDPRNISHYHFLLFKAQYFHYLKDFKKYIELLKEIINYFPGLPGGYCKLSELYSNKKEAYFNIEKALFHSKKQAQIEGMSLNYYEGISYSSANEPEKAIQKLKQFVLTNEIPFDYINAYQDLSLNYFKVNDKENGCHWGKKWFDRYNIPQKQRLYQGSIIESKKEKQRDYEFMLILSGNCWNLKEKVEPEINRINLETDRLDLAMNFERQKNENERLQHEIQRIENELSAIRKKFIDVENLSEEDIERIYWSIENKSSEKMKIYKRLNEDLWVEVGESIEKIYPHIKDMPHSIQIILHSTEFILESNSKEADFSVVILNFAKVMEIILDENISKPFVKKIDLKYIDLNIKEPNIKRLVKERKSISLGGWCHLIENYISKNNIVQDKIIEQFIKELKLLESDISKIDESCKFVGELRNGVAHTKIISLEEVNKHMNNFRKTINYISNIFYFVKIN